jgi:hypothetical protein
MQHPDVDLTNKCNTLTLTNKHTQHRDVDLTNKCNTLTLTNKHTQHRDVDLTNKCNTLTLTNKHTGNTVTFRYETSCPSSADPATTTIDVWWILHDGGMLILIAYLLQQDKAWARCR